MKISLAHPSLIFYVCSLFSSVSCRTCYYPNGDASTSTDIPCLTDGDGPCCPQGWQCLSNGLCYLENQKFLGRYTCTDQTWKSSACPQICTHDNTAAGDEAILQCSPGQYCCDANRPDIDNPPKPGCCDTGGQLFPLPSGSPIASGQSYTFSIASEPGGASPSSTSSTESQTQTTTSDAPSSSSTSSSKSSPETTHATSSSSTSSSTSAPGTTSNPSSSSSSSDPNQITVTTIISTGPNAVVSTLTIRAPGTTATPPPGSANNVNEAYIIGPSVGGAVLIIAIAALAFFLWRKRKRSRFVDPETSFQNARHSANTTSWGSVEKGEIEDGGGQFPQSSVPPQPEPEGPPELDGRELPYELAGSSPLPRPGERKRPDCI